MTGLPSGWAVTTIDSIGELVTGSTPSTSMPEFWDGEIPFVTPGDLNGAGLYCSQSARSVTESGAASGRILPKGAVLVSCIGKIGKVGILDRPGLCNQQINAVIPKSPISPEFIGYWACNSTRWLEDHASATTLPILNKGRFSDAPVCLPPLNEQRRIVAKLDALFEKSRSIREKLDRLPRLLANLQKSILNSAFRGDLTKEWRANDPNVEPASELLKRIRAERRAKWEADLIAKGKDPKRAKYVEPERVDTEGLPKLPEGWCWASVGEINICLDSVRVPIKRELRNAAQGLYPYFGANGQVGVIDEYLFDEELVLVTEDETFYGRTKPIAYRVSGKCWVNNHAHVLRAVEPISPDFIWLSLMFYDVIPWLSGTTGRAKLTQGALMTLPIALPPHAEIEELVGKVKAAFDALERLSPATDEIASRIEQYERSTLAKAFRGELVPQDPNDEPASVLLERIRAQKPAVGTKRGRGRKAAA